MRTHLIVTLTCPDRPGIVERLTDAMAPFSGNWEESRMARLGGDFAGIVKVSVSQERAEALADALRALADEQMTVLVKAARPAASEAQEGRVLYQLRLTGADHEGIVHEVSGYLAGRGVNFETMETNVLAAPVSGSPLFHLDAQISAPAQLPLSDLQANLDRIADDQGVDIEVFPRGQ